MRLSSYLGLAHATERKNERKMFDWYTQVCRIPDERPPAPGRIILNRVVPCYLLTDQRPTGDFRSQVVHISPFLMEVATKITDMTG